MLFLPYGYIRDVHSDQKVGNVQGEWITELVSAMMHQLTIHIIDPELGFPGQALILDMQDIPGRVGEEDIVGGWSITFLLSIHPAGQLS